MDFAALATSLTTIITGAIAAGAGLYTLIIGPRVGKSVFKSIIGR